MAKKRKIYKRFASAAYGEGYGDMTPEQRAARSTWLADNKARESQLARDIGLGDAALGRRAGSGTHYGRREDAGAAGATQLRELEVVAGSRQARTVGPSHKPAKPLFTRSAVAVLLSMGKPEISALHARALQMFECVPPRGAFEERINAARRAAVDSAARDLYERGSDE